MSRQSARMATTEAPLVEGIKFQAKQVTDNERIYRAAVRYLLKQLGKEAEKLPKEIDITAWL
jgi:hypothetical protein